MTALMPPLRALAVKSAAWYGATRIWGQAISWAVTILLARVLTPQDYGLFAIALSVLTLLELLQEFGLGTAIVQHQDITPQQVNAVFWIVTTTSLALTAVTFVAAGSISALYAEPRLAWTLRVLCLTFLLNSLGMVPYNLLTKDLNLRYRSLAEACGSATSAVVALLFAYHGYGVWALVLGHLARAIILNSALAILARWTPSLDVTFDGMRRVITFGLQVVGTHIVGSFNLALQTMILARLLGGRAVGLYSMGQSLAEGPHRISTAIINQVSLPVFSKLQRDDALLRIYYLKISKYLAAVSLPLQAGLLLVAADLIPLLLSDKWEGIVTPFQLFCMESAIVVMTLTSSPLLTARGRPDLLFRLSTLSVFLQATAILVGARFGLTGVVAARLIAIAILRSSVLVLGLRELSLSVSVFLGNLRSPLTATGLMVAAVLLADSLPLPNAGRLEHLAIRVVVGAAVYPIALLFLDRNLGSDVRTMAHDLFSASKAA
jgi:O-antigen/teichoic acid export membrane protein